jgi:hypothetical protein
VAPAASDIRTHRPTRCEISANPLYTSSSDAIQRPLLEVFVLATNDESLDPSPVSQVAVSVTRRSKAATPVAHSVALVDDEATVSKDASVQSGRRTVGESDQMSEAMARRDEDAALVARALAGDQVAFAELEARTAKALYGFIRSRVGHVDQDTGKFIANYQIVDDLVQKTWIDLLPRLASYDPSRALFATFATKQADFIVKRYRASAKRDNVLTSLEAGARGKSDPSGNTRFDPPTTPGGTGYPAPEDPVDVDVYDELVALIFATDSPPHQLIAFGFVKGLKWKPSRVAAELSDIALRALEPRFEVEYLEQSEIPPERITPSFARLRASLDLRFADAVSDPVTLKTYPALHDRIVGETTLADYYRKDPSADITQWWYAVTRRVIAEIDPRGTGPLAELLRQTQSESKKK